MSEQRSIETGDLSDTKKVLEQYIGGKPRVLYLISPGVDQGTNDVKYKSSSMLGKDYLRGSFYGYNGGALRVWAVADIYRFFPENTQVITSSISPANDQTGLSEPISHAKVQERELKRVWEKRGVIPPETIIKEENSFNTITELAELVTLIVDNNWEGNIIAVTNDYHVERTTKMLERLPSLLDPSKPEYERYKNFPQIWQKFKEKEQSSNVNIVIKGAESTLMLTDAKFKHALENALSQEPWKSALKLRESLEEQGVEALETGSYESKPLKIV